MSKPFPNRIALAEFWEKWPKDESGMRARRMMLELLGTMLVDSALSRVGTPEAKDGSQLAVAKIFEAVRGITAEKKERRTITASPALHRFSGENAEQQKPADKK